MKAFSPPTTSFWRLFAATPEPTRLSSPSRFWELFMDERRFRKSRRQAAMLIRQFEGELVFATVPALESNASARTGITYGTVGNLPSKDATLLLRSLSGRIQNRLGCWDRSICRDREPDAISVVSDFGLRPADQSVWLLNPFDRRNDVQELGRLVNTPGMAAKLAALLVPLRNSDSHGRLRETADTVAARSLVVAAVFVLNQIAGTHWTFKDLFSRLGSKESIVDFTTGYPTAAKIVASVVNDEARWPAVHITLSDHLRSFEQILAMHGSACISLWLLTGVIDPRPLN